MFWLPTALSALRLLLTPLIAWAILRSDWAAAIGWVFIAGWSDFFDGYLARKFDWRTKAGAIVDPIADKTLLVVLYVCLGVVEAVPRWLVFLVLGRDVVILAMAAIALAFTKIRDFPPSMLGKTSTVVQLVTAVTVLVARSGWLGDIDVLARSGVALTAVFTGLSGADYVRRAAQRLMGVRDMKVTLKRPGEPPSSPRTCR